jgi:hypothetical protein
MKPKKFEYKVDQRKSISADLNKFCVLSKEHDFIEITEWTNGEGYDITINERLFMFSHGQLDAIRILVKQLNKS